MFLIQTCPSKGRCAIQAASVLWHMRKSPHNRGHPVLSKIKAPLNSIKLSFLIYFYLIKSRWPSQCPLCFESWIRTLPTRPNTDFDNRGTLYSGVVLVTATEIQCWKGRMLHFVGGNSCVIDHQGMGQSLSQLMLLFFDRLLMTSFISSLFS